MVTDLPDYTKRQVLIIDIADFPQEVMVDHRKILGETLKIPTEPYCLPSSIENIVRINHEQIKGLALKDPTIPLSVPVSWEGPYLAYEPCLDALKVKILEWVAGTLPVSLSTLLNPHPITQTDAALLKATVSAIDLDIRALTSVDVVTVKSITDALPAGSNAIGKLAANSGVDIGDVDVITMPDVKQSNETLLKATVTQAAKDRTVTGTVTAAQTTRTNLLAKTEREDLLCKSFDLTVGTTSLLAAVAGQYHKVYGWDYESDTDGANEFSATISGVACKFARRVTKGVHAMTLVHPIICDVNSALSFISAGNTKLSLRYKTEA